MSSIGTSETKMTVFFSKSTGDIKNIVKGVHDMSFYGDNEQDFSIIWDLEVLNYDQFILYNANLFVFDVDGRFIKFKSDSKIMDYLTK